MEDEEENEDDYWANYDSGPFCQHWDEAHECDQLCKCGHQCKDHFDGHCDLCKCKQFEDKE